MVDMNSFFSASKAKGASFRIGDSGIKCARLDTLGINYDIQKKTAVIRQRVFGQVMFPFF
jgi:hypothetical protein